MGIRQRLEEKIKKKEQEIADHESSIREAKAYMQAVNEALKLLPREQAKASTPERLLRPGASAHKALQVLKASDDPMHISDILRAIKMDNSKLNRISLGATLSRYSRNGEIFKKTGPNTFGLTEKKYEGHEEPPEDFGLIDDGEIEGEFA